MATKIGMVPHKRFVGSLGQVPGETKVDTSVYVPPEDTRKGPQPATMRNKHMREELYQKQKHQKRKDKRERRKKRKRDIEVLGEEEVKKRTRPQRTLDNTREFDETVVDPDDEEVVMDQQTDELAAYFDGRKPKVLITTSNRALGETQKFAEMLSDVIPDSEMHPRKGFALKKIIPQAVERGYTDLVVVNEDRKKPTAVWVCHLPDGPTAQFKLTSIQYPKEIRGHGRDTGHYPEVITNNFHTRLGLQVGRCLTALFPQQPEFQGREVVTWHNQRDFIFFRRHRYKFHNKEKVGLQEIGPRFTVNVVVAAPPHSPLQLKLRTLQKGTFDSKFGEYEWVHKRGEMDTSRRRFFL